MKILIADDHRLVVEAVAGKLATLEPDVAVVTAYSVADLVALLDDSVALALIDLSMPGARGVEHVAQVHQCWPQLKIIVLSGVEEQAAMRAALDAGASGFIPKAFSPDVMLSAVRQVLDGGIYLPPLMMGLGAAMDLGRAGAAEIFEPYAVSLTPTPAQLRAALTERQLDVLNHLSAGLPNKQIARSLGISEGTVKIHLAAIFRTLRARNRTEAVIAARALHADENLRENVALAPAYSAQTATE